MVVDASSSVPVFPDLQQLQVSRPQSLDLTTVKKEVQQGPRYLTIMVDKEVNSILHSRYQVYQEMLFYQGRLVLMMRRFDVAVEYTQTQVKIITKLTNLNIKSLK